ncbi:MAG: hypothetical protein ACE5HQ_11345 [Gemmatimonadota bacterium]
MRRCAVVALAVLPAAGVACLQTGEPTPDAALVTWAAYPETVRIGKTFSFEFAGPVAPNGCARLDTAMLAIPDFTVELSARRSTFDALCARQRVSFYAMRPLKIERAGRYRVRTAEGLYLGTLIAVDSGRVSTMKSVGEGTVRGAGGCWLFGPGWAANQRPFALRGAPRAVLLQAGTDRVVHVEGRLIGFAACGRYGSRPTIRVDTAWVTDRRGADYYVPTGY